MTWVWSAPTGNLAVRETEGQFLLVEDDSREVTRTARGSRAFIRILTKQWMRRHAGSRRTSVSVLGEASRRRLAELEATIS